MRAALWFSAVFAVLGVLTGLVVFATVRAGGLEATGAPPGGILAGWGFFGTLLAVLFHAAVGMVYGLNQWWVAFTGLFLLLFGLVGAVRRRRPWYAFLSGPALWVAGMLATAFSTWAMGWLGSASEWDAAASTSAVLGTSLTAIGQVPLWGIWIWRWCNNRPLIQGEIEDRYAATVRGVGEVFGGFGGVAASVLLFAGGIGLFMFAWERGGVFGIVLALVASGVIGGVLMAVSGAVMVALNGAAALSVGLPIASVLVLLPAGTRGVAVTELEDGPG